MDSQPMHHWYWPVQSPSREQLFNWLTFVKTSKDSCSLMKFYYDWGKFLSFLLTLGARKPGCFKFLQFKGVWDVLWNQKCISSSCLNFHYSEWPTLPQKCFLFNRKINSKQIKHRISELRVCFVSSLTSCFCASEKKGSGAIMFWRKPKPHRSCRCMQMGKEKEHTRGNMVLIPSWGKPKNVSFPVCDSTQPWWTQWLSHEPRPSAAPLLSQPHGYSELNKAEKSFGTSVYVSFPQYCATQWNVR